MWWFRVLQRKQCRCYSKACACWGVGSVPSCTPLHGTLATAKSLQEQYCHSWAAVNGETAYMSKCLCQKTISTFWLHAAASHCPPSACRCVSLKAVAVLQHVHVSVSVPWACDCCCPSNILNAVWLRLFYCPASVGTSHHTRGWTHSGIPPLPDDCQFSSISLSPPCWVEGSSWRLGTLRGQLRADRDTISPLPSPGATATLRAGCAEVLGKMSLVCVRKALKINRLWRLTVLNFTGTF